MNNTNNDSQTNQRPRVHSQRPPSAQRMNSVADLNPFGAEAANFDDFVSGVSTVTHQLRVYLLLVTGVHGDKLTVADAEMILGWQDMLTRIERQGDAMLQRYLDNLPTEERGE